MSTNLSTPQARAANPASTQFNPSSPDLFVRLEAYDWNADPSFLSGLSAILGPNPSNSPPSRLSDLSLRARCFYFARQFDQPVNYDAYLEWRNHQSDDALASLDTDLAAVRNAHCDMSSPPESGPNTPEIGQTYDNTDSDTRRDRATNGNHLIAPDSHVSGTSHNPGPLPGYPQTFAEVMELIQAGKPIPGIRDIPSTVLQGQASHSRISQRPKPWELKKPS